MQLVDKKIALVELNQMTEKMFGDFVKAVVDIEKEIMVVDAELHSDEEGVLLDNDSLQKNLWGINIHPAKPIDEWIEFDSMINIRPSQGNRTCCVDDKAIQEKIKKIVNKLVVR